VEFFFLIASLTLYYIRPQEWMIQLQDFHVVGIVGGLTILSMLRRKEGFNRREIFQAPMDYLIPVYLLWIIFVTPEHKDAFDTQYPLYVYYLMTALCLTTIERINRFLMCWALLIFAISGLAVLSEYGIDPTGAYDITHGGGMKDRLCLGTSIFNNPNALGHSVVPVVLMLYYLLIWRRPIFSRIIALPLMGVPLYCIYLTISKGAFLSGFITSVASMTFGRPKLVQIAVVAVALTSGWTAMQNLPRMDEIRKGKQEGGIMGRVHAFSWGLKKLNGSWMGIGREQFLPQIERETGWRKASHSAYVEAGAELGKVGFFMFITILYLSLKSLLLARCENPEHERARRVLFTLVIGFIISAWMVDILYRPVMFLFAGTICAFQRLLTREQLKTQAAEETQTASELLHPMPGFAMSKLSPNPALAAPSLEKIITQTTIEIPMKDRPADLRPAAVAWKRFGIDWNRYTLVDFGMCLLLSWGTVKLWEKAIERMS
jgi:hypothetical protein